MSPLDDFAQSVITGQADIVTGVYVPGVLALRVVQQPSGKFAFVSERMGVATQFGIAAHYGTVGLLAHNYRSGRKFFRLVEGQKVYIVYGDGKYKAYEIRKRHRYRALTPTSPYSSFIDLDGGERLPSAQVFARIYGRNDDRVVFQTCIRAYGESAWGRLFVIASPVE